MPYTQIYWIKLEKRLLNDHRFFTMTEKAQLIYVKMLMLAGETNNKIPKNIGILKTLLKTEENESSIGSCVEELKTNFPKFKESKNFYFFVGWKTRHNWVVGKEFRGNSEGTNKLVTEKNRIDKKRIDSIMGEFIKVKNWEGLAKGNPAWLSDTYKRYVKAAKRLAQIAGDEAEECIRWGANALDTKKLTWTLETIVAWYPNFKSQPTQKVRAL